jgi:hypothetical protein
VPIPIGPVFPWDPVGPVGPIDPVGPVVPIPIGPVFPWDPVGPVGPIGPIPIASAPRFKFPLKSIHNVDPLKIPLLGLDVLGSRTTPPLIFIVQLEVSNVIQGFPVISSFFSQRIALSGSPEISNPGPGGPGGPGGPRGPFCPFINCIGGKQILHKLLFSM